MGKRRQQPSASCELLSCSAARRIGSLTVNLVRLVIAFVYLSLAGLVLRGLPLPSDATAHNWLWLTVSGLVGFTFGDLCLFRAFVVLGPRLSTLVMSLSPPIAALLGWAILGELLSARDLVGMSLTVAGIAWAVSERQPADRSHGRAERPVAGVLLALGGAAWGLAAGVLGCILLALWVLTDHEFAWRNENLLQTNPLALGLVVLVPVAVLRGGSRGAFLLAAGYTLLNGEHVRIGSMKLLYYYQNRTAHIRLAVESPGESAGV